MQLNKQLLNQQFKGPTRTRTPALREAEEKTVKGIKVVAQHSYHLGGAGVLTNQWQENSWVFRSMTPGMRETIRNYLRYRTDRILATRARPAWRPLRGIRQLSDRLRR